MIIILTQRATEFADRCDGADALRARVELEVEELLDGKVSEIEAIAFHIFSWNGNENLIMFPEGPCLMVDLNDDDNGDINAPIDPNLETEREDVLIPA